MNIALLGYGRMGQTIGQLAKERGHSIVLTVDNNEEYSLENADVAIDFSIPDAAVSNITKCLKNNVPVVSGTTGWLDAYADMEKLCAQENGAFLYASNFSVGVNVFFELNKQLAKMMQHLEEYKVSMKEIHHIHKLDAPSGTAISLAEGILEHNNASGWILDKEENEKLTITAERKEEVPGTHRVTYESEIDEINIEHKAHSRKGFALGAVLAAEWLQDKKGTYSMKDVLGL